MCNEYKEAILLVLSFPALLHFSPSMIYSSAYCRNDDEGKTSPSVFTTGKDGRVFTDHPAIILAWGKYFFSHPCPCLGFSPQIFDESPSGPSAGAEVGNGGKNTDLGAGAWDGAGMGNDGRGWATMARVSYEGRGQ